MITLLMILISFFVFGLDGEIQEAEVSLPVISHRYTMDLSRTRSYFLPGYPLDVVVTDEYTATVCK